ncbi:MAG: type VI secretion system ATPase TssH, partial [Gammaproteobacteria bacterium]|nr:type VI secretion system ATPase TssH [Gammaproteobacteria bacterium]
NLGSDLIQSIAQQPGDEPELYEQMKSATNEVVAQHFRPEFINRIDDMVVFHPLTIEQLTAISAIQIAELASRLKLNGFGLEVSDSAMTAISEAGFDPVFGARPLKRVIQQRLENPLAEAILSGTYAQGDMIKIDWQNDSLTIQ